MKWRKAAAGLGGAAAAGVTLIAASTMWFVVHDPLAAARAAGEDHFAGLVLAALRLVVHTLAGLLQV